MFLTVTLKDAEHNFEDSRMEFQTCPLKISNCYSYSVMFTGIDRDISAN